MNAVAAALRELASLNETEPSVRAALEAWPEVVFSGAVAGAVRDVARRIRLGATTHDALAPLCELGPDGTTLRRVIAGHAHHGGSLATSLRSLADVIEDRDRLAHEGQVAGAAARLSGRLLALIGGGSILVVIVSEPALDGSTVVSAGAAAALVAAGVAWTRRLLPRVPRGDDPVAAQVDLLAGLVSGGVSLTEALGVVTQRDDAVVSLRVAAARVRLGMGWVDALDRCDDPSVGPLAAVCRRAVSGSPVQGPLRAIAADLRERRRREATIQARRATVLLVVPLALCFLPAFGLVMVVPLLRAVTG